MPAAPAAAVVAPARDRHPVAAHVRLERGRVGAERLAPLALFASLDAAQLERVARSARPLSAAAGEEIVRRWEAARDFYVLLDGSATVRRDGEHLGDLGPGDFFGELAALEWGAGFGYPRLASVVATTGVEAVVLSSDAFNALLRDAPDVARIVWAAVRERLPRS
jgi:CRP-like cAMP-binding protein